MAKMSKKAFKHFDDTEIYNVFDDELKSYRDELWYKMQATKFRAEFMFKCLYDGEKPLSKKDYSRTRFTHRKICDKMDRICNCKTKSEDQAFQEGCRKLLLSQKGYPFGLNAKNGMENPEIKKFIKTGKYKKGGFIDKWIV